MQTPLTLMHTGLLVIIAMAVWEVVKIAIHRFFKKTVDTEYVTVSRCIKCREECSAQREAKDKTADNKNGEFDEKLDKIGNTLDSFREVLFEIAMKDGIDPEKVKPLLKRG